MICFSDSYFKFLNNNLFPFREIKYHKDCIYNAGMFLNEEACEKICGSVRKLNIQSFIIFIKMSYKEFSFACSLIFMEL